MQEVALTRSILVQCGSSSTSWEELDDTAQFLALDHQHMISIIRIHHIQEQSRDWTPPSESTDDTVGYAILDIRVRAAKDLLSMIYEHRLPSHSLRLRFHRHFCTDITSLGASQNSDPRDTVFVLLSIGEDTCGSGVLFLDYSKTRCEVFVDFFNHVVHSTRCLNLIFLPWAVCDEQAEQLTLASWICTVRSNNSVGAAFRIEEPRIETELTGRSTVCLASGKSFNVCETRRDTRLDVDILQAKGFVIDHVTLNCAHANGGRLLVSWRRHIQHGWLWTVLLAGKSTVQG